ncbi:hypothetical protein VJJ74_04375 [Parvimonas micra]|uniref:hypothetical protein n=1 Tax=Parvimonas micra TaxID=33033 RepID=UPI00248EA70B|nr:hypothetical protein [Parvimonas micra]MEB3060379.1 hypothetical protein [Parvimonas micra]MEB3066235.1 hypothetical protein [Parvimonas micra]
MPKSGGPSKSNSIFDPKKKGLTNKNDKNKFGTSSSNGKNKGLGEKKPLMWPQEPIPPGSCCMGCSGTADLNIENIEL